MADKATQAPDADVSGVSTVKGGKGGKKTASQPKNTTAAVNAAVEQAPPPPAVSDADVSGASAGTDQVPPVQDPGTPEDPAQDPAPEVVVDVPKKERVHKIESEDEAREHFHAEGYALPEGENFAFMTADGNVFFRDNRDSGAAHARTFKLPYYQFQP